MIIPAGLTALAQLTITVSVVSKPLIVAVTVVPVSGVIAPAVMLTILVKMLVTGSNVAGAVPDMGLDTVDVPLKLT